MAFLIDCFVRRAVIDQLVWRRSAANGCFEPNADVGSFSSYAIAANGRFEPILLKNSEL